MQKLKGVIMNELCGNEEYCIFEDCEGYCTSAGICEYQFFEDELGGEDYE